jgi:hypothetical protein
VRAFAYLCGKIIENEIEIEDEIENEIGLFGMYGYVYV